jgi:hypothetical protein
LPKPIDTFIPGGKASLPVGREVVAKTKNLLKINGEVIWGGYDKIDDMDYSASCFSDLNS